MLSADTSPKAAAVYYRLLAGMTPTERVNRGVALLRAGDATQRAGIRHMYPDADENEINFHLCSRRYGPDLARKIYKK